MATLREAIEQSKNNPEDPRAKALYQAIKGGQMDQKALEEGVDLSWAGRMKTGPQFQVQMQAPTGPLAEAEAPEPRPVAQAMVENRIEAVKEPVQAVKEVWGDVKEGGIGLAGDLKERYDTARLALQRGRVGGEITPLEGGFQAAAQVAGAVSDAFGQAVITVGKIGLTQEEEDAVKQGMMNIVEATGIDDAIARYEAWAEENPRVADNVEAAGSIAAFLADVVGIGIASKSPKVIKEGLGEATTMIREGTEAAGVQAVGTARQLGREVTGLATSMKEVAFKTPKVMRDKFVRLKYGDDAIKAVDELEKAYSEIPLPKGVIQMESQTGKSFARFMAEHPHARIDVRDMKYDTYGVAQQLRKEAGVEAEALQTLLRDRTEMVSLDKIKSDVKQAVSKTTSGQERNAALRYIDNEFDAFKEQNAAALFEDDMMKLADANRLKQGLWDRSPFNPTASRQDRLASSIDYKMGQAFRRNIEESIPDVDLKGLNAELGDYYHSIDILERLHGGAAPRGRIGLEFARMGGAIAGTPAGIMGSIVGYMTADKIAKVLVSESLGQNFRRYAVSQLMEKRPSVAKQVIEILEKEQGLRATRELLPEGAIPMGPATTRSTIETLTPERYSPAPQSPETGQFFKAYKSTNVENKTQPGLSTQDVSGIPKQITPQSVARKIDTEDRDIIARFLDNPNGIDEFMEIDPLINQMGIQNADAETIIRFLKDVLEISEL